MGIQGLLPFLKDATQQVNVRKYSGYTVAVDTYCWIHRGAFGCAMQLAKGEQTDMYVRYCLKFINMLRGMDVKPILVFDGSHLPAKKAVEESRRERRELYSKKGKQFLREGKASEARDCFTKCVNVTPQMALEVIKAARSLGVDCIVAPYEADAQLAYLAIRGIVQAVITEDSDLVAFGCPRVLYKLDLNGNGLEVQASWLNKAMKIGDRFSPDKFRYMCIASGCDYLPSLPGIGLGKAKKLFQAATNPDLIHVLKRLPIHLKMKLTVTQEYIDGFIQANNTFLHQLAFDPMQRRLVPLHPYGPDVDKESLDYAGAYCSSDVALQQALGNLDPGTKKRICNFKPEYHKPYDKSVPRHSLSIWHRDYRPGPDFSEKGKPTDVQRTATKGKEVSVKVLNLERQARKRPRPETEDDTPTINDLTSIYGSPSAKKHSVDKSLVVPDTPESDEKEQNRPSPRRRNPFSRGRPKGDSPQQGQKFGAEERVAKTLSRRNIFAKVQSVSSSRRLQMLKGNTIVKSRFFAAKPDTTPQETPKDIGKPVDRESPVNTPSSLDRTDDSEDERMNKDTVPDPNDELTENVCEVTKTSTMSTLNRLQRFQRSVSTSALPSSRSKTTFPTRKDKTSNEPENIISLLDSDSNLSTSQGNSQESSKFSKELSQELSQVSRTPSQGVTQRRRGAFSWSRSTSLSNLISGNSTRSLKSLNDFRRRPGSTRLTREGSQSLRPSLEVETSAEDLSQESSAASVNMYSIDTDSISLSQLSTQNLASSPIDSQTQEFETRMSSSCSDSLQRCSENPEAIDKVLSHYKDHLGNHTLEQKKSNKLYNKEIGQNVLPNRSSESEVEIERPEQNHDSKVNSSDRKFQEAVGNGTENQSEGSESKKRTSKEETSSSHEDDGPGAILDVSFKAVDDGVCIDLTSDSDDENSPPVISKKLKSGSKLNKIKMKAETLLETPKLPNVPKLKTASTTKVNQCKASGLSRRHKGRQTPKADENSGGGGPRQQTLFAFMKKNSKPTSEGGVIKPLSPAKENIICDVTPDSDNSICSKGLVRVQRNIFH